MATSDATSLASYRGRVDTLTATTFDQTGPITYDPDMRRFFMFAQTNAGGGVFAIAPNGSSTLLAQYFGNEGGIAYDHGDATLYFTTAGSCSVESLSPKTGAIAFLAGGSCGTNDGQGNAAQFQGPSGITVDEATQTLYVADHDRVRAVTTSGNVTTLTAPGLLGTNYEFCSLETESLGITYDTANADLYVSQPCANIIYQVSTVTGSVTAVAGSCVTNRSDAGQCVQLEEDGAGSSALFAAPNSLEYDAADGNIYIVDSANNQVRILAPDFSVSTLAGNGHGYLSDGIGRSVAFWNPLWAAIGPAARSLYVVDWANKALRTVTLMGANPPPPPHGVTMIDLPTPDAGPFGIAATSDGSIWFTEENTDKIGRRWPNGAFTEYTLPEGTAPGRLVLSGGALWFSGFSPQTGQGWGAIGRITMTGVTKIYALPQLSQFSIPVVNDMIAGPDGNVWFVDASSQAIGYIRPNGAYRHFVSANISFVIGRGGPNDLWSNIYNANGGLDDYGTNGKLLKEYLYPVFPTAIAPGPDGREWFTGLGMLGEVRRGTFLLHLLPGVKCCGTPTPTDLELAGDGAFWMPANPGYLFRYAPRAPFGEWILAVPRSAPTELTFAADGTPWIADPGADKIGYYR